MRWGENDSLRMGVTARESENLVLLCNNVLGNWVDIFPLLGITAGKMGEICVI